MRPWSSPSTLNPGDSNVDGASLAQAIRAPHPINQRRAAQPRPEREKPPGSPPKGSTQLERIAVTWCAMQAMTSAASQPRSVQPRRKFNSAIARLLDLPRVAATAHGSM